MELRLDKWLWAVRIFKTRSDSAEACRTGKVTVCGTTAKPSREIKRGDTISVRRGALTYSYKVLELVSSRQSAKLIEQFVQNITPKEEMDKLNIPKESIFVSRERGTGRPTKKERRDIDLLMDAFYLDDDQ